MIDIESKEHLLNAVLEYCEDIVTVKDLSLRYVAYNKAFLKGVNATLDTPILGKTLADVLPFDCVNVIETSAQKAIKTKETQSFIAVLNYPSGNKIFKQTVTPIMKNNKVVNLLSVSTDVTKEETLKAKLITKNYQINTLIDNLPLLVYMKDKNRNLIVANDNAKKFVYEGIDVFSNNLKIDVPTVEEETANEDNYVLINKKTLHKEKSAKDDDGNIHWYKISKVPILTEENDVMGLVTIAKNIDTEKSLENQKSLFLATLSHDLKNTLQAQISSLELFNKGTFGELNSTQKEMLDMIIESSKYMREMLYTLLRTGKDNNGCIVLKRSYFNLEKLIYKCTREIHDLALSKNIRIKIDSKLKPDDLIFADEIQMRRVIGNMLNNGINYAFENTTLTIDITKKHNNLILQMTNESAEIPESIKEHVFDKYVCGDVLQSNTGIGLGLYFCKKVIEANEGHIHLIASGTKNMFEIKLPILSEDSALISEIVL